jgi:hypothetical protein
MPAAKKPNAAVTRPDEPWPARSPGNDDDLSGVS